jgi:hypothetical protein
MKTAFLLSFIVLACCTFAGERPVDIPAVSFAPFPLPILRHYISAATGRPAGKATLNSPFPDDFPPSTTVAFEDGRKYKIPDGSYAFPSRNYLRVYRISDIHKAPYKTIQSHFEVLRRVLKARPAEVPNDEATLRSLPDYPPRNAAHAFELHLGYVDAPWGSGICYMTLFTQDGSGHANNDELQYLFQGLSKDNAFYVSADFRVTHPRLNHFTWPETEKGDYSADCKLLSLLKPNTFSPSLPDIQRWLATLKIE